MKKRQERLYAAVSQLLNTIAQGDNFALQWDEQRPAFKRLLDDTQADYEDVSKHVEVLAERIFKDQEVLNKRLFTEES